MRKTWDEYFLAMAKTVAERSTCNRKQVGCVLVRDNVVLSTGYGGSIRGQPHCLDVGCDIDPKTGGCVRTVHAEMNAISQAALNGVSTKGSTAYITLSPCDWCFKTLVNSGVDRIVYSEEYRIPPDFKLVAACGVRMQHIPDAQPAEKQAPTVKAKSGR
jgi:dCMP deaminase